MSRKNQIVDYMNEQSLNQSEAKMTGILIDLIRSTVMKRADKYMREDDFERAANNYFLASHMCPTSEDETVTLYNYKIGKAAVRAIQEDLEIPINRQLTTDTLREYARYLDQNK